MHPKISALKAAINKLHDAILNKGLPEQSFTDSLGWNTIAISPDNILNFIYNITEKLDGYEIDTIPSSLDDVIDVLIERVKQQTQLVDTYLALDPNRVTPIVTSTFILIQLINNELDTSLFSWSSINSNKLAPKNIKTRLRALNSRLDALEGDCSDINEKVITINNAYETAESLPAVIQDLNDAKNRLTSTINETRDEINKYKNEISEIKAFIGAKKSESISMHDNIKNLLEKTNAYAQSASSLVEQCDDALQITTTQGLAAGFDQKATELRNSIWVWIAGLLIALSVGLIIGSARVTEFSAALKDNLTAGQAILHTIISIFSIGGPLWLAWISTQQINHRFKLSEDYSYKATVAKAFTGFRKISQDFNQETSERLFNSTLDRLDEMPLRLLSGKDYNSPWHEFIDSEAFKKAIDMVPSLAKEAGRFAENTKLNKKIPVPKSDEKPVKAKQEEKTTVEAE